MTPSSGARSGTRPSRHSRGAGTGTISPAVKLACGHTTDRPPVATCGGRALHACLECASLQWRRR